MNKESKVLRARWTCMNGQLAKCAHIISVLIQLRFEITGKKFRRKNKEKKNKFGEQKSFFNEKI